MPKEGLNQRRCGSMKVTESDSYSFYICKGEGRLRIYSKSVRKFKDKIREITGRTMGWELRREKTG